MFSHALSSASLILIFVCCAVGQVDTGTIAGSVLDPSGAGVPASRVKVLDSETGVSFETVTNAFGFYAAPNLRPSTYALAASAPGFRTLTKTGILLRLQDRLSVDFPLEVGQSTGELLVVGSLPRLETESSSLGMVVESRAMNALPLNGRNYIQLATLGAGTSPSQRTQERNTFVANGARPIQNSYLLDGVDNKNKILGFDAAPAQSVEPVLDAIDEFKVQTSTFSAEFGQSAGAVVNATIKSGTNGFHGSLFEFARNSFFDARPYFQPPGTASPALNENQFGATLGGPVVRNRTFFFLAWQSSRERSSAPQLAFVPTAANVGGRFTQAIYDPASTRPNPNGAGYIRDPFPGRVIPVNRFDAVAAKLVGLYPAPNLTPSPNYFSNQKEELSSDQYIARVDHHIGTKDSVFARYIRSTITGILPGLMPPPANDVSVNETAAHSLAASQTHIVRPNLMSEARFGFQQPVEHQQTLGPRLFDQYGILGAPDISDVHGLPIFGIAGFSPLGTAGPGTLPVPATGSGNVPLDKMGRTIQAAENLTWVRGRHTVKSGFDFQQVTAFANSALYARPAFSFNGSQTQDPQNRAVTGAAFADFLLGQTYAAYVSSTSVAEIRQNVFQGYIQDDWKITPSLSLNLGVRYELPMPFYETSGRYANLILEGGPMFGRILDAGQADGAGYRRSFSDPDYSNIAPRVGFAYRLGSRTVLRSGFGVFFGRDENLGTARRPTNNPPYVILKVYGGGTAPSDIILANGFPSDALDPANVTQPTVVSVLRHAPTPYVQQWNLNLQRELSGGLVLQAAYVGSGAHALYYTNQINTPLPAAGRVQDRRPMPEYGPILSYAPLISSNYNSLQVQVERRYAAGLSLLAAYTWSHSIDNGSSIADKDGFSPQNPFDFHAERGSSNFDVTHRVSGSFVWRLPFGRGGRFLTSGIPSAFLGGWQLAAIVTAQTGLPFTPVLSTDPAGSGTAVRPNRVGSGVAANPSVQSWFDTSAFVAPPAYTWGNSGRNILRGPGFLNVDTGLSRTFPLGERIAMDLRGGAFNLLNTPQLGLPNPTLFVRTTGVISTVVNPERQLQLALRLRF